METGEGRREKPFRGKEVGSGLSEVPVSAQTPAFLDLLPANGSCDSGCVMLGRVGTGVTAGPASLPLEASEKSASR